MGFSSLNPLNDLSNGFRDAVTYIIVTLGKFLQTSTGITFSPHYTSLIHTDIILTSVSALVILLFQTAHSAITGNMKILGSAIVNSIVAILMGSILLIIVPLINYVVGVFSTAVMTSTLKNSFSSNNGIFHLGFITPLATGQPIGNNPELVIVFGFLIIVAAAICYVMLLIAAAVGYITLFFTPLAWSINPKTGRKMLEVTIFVLFAPFFITASLAIATSLMTASVYTGIAAVGQILIGVVLLFISAFSPFMIFKFLPMTHAASLSGAHEGIKSTAAKAKSHTTKAASFVTGSPKAAVGGSGGGFVKSHFGSGATLGGLSTSKGAAGAGGAATSGAAAAASGGATVAAGAVTKGVTSVAKGVSKGAAAAAAGAAGVAAAGGIAVAHHEGGKTPSGTNGSSGAAGSGGSVGRPAGSPSPGASGAVSSQNNGNPGSSGAAGSKASGSTGSGGGSAGNPSPSASGAVSSQNNGNPGSSGAAGSGKSPSSTSGSTPLHINRDKFKDKDV